MKELEYEEFEVLLERSGDGYSARVVESPTGPVPALPFVPPQPLGGLPALRLAVRGGAAEADDATAPTSPKQFGADLFRALFNDKALAILRTSQYVAAKRQRGLRLRIRFADATPLANLPWELLYDPERHWYPCQLSRFPTLRFVDLPEPVLPLRVSGPLRMLVAISSPIDLPQLEVEREWTLLRNELDPLVQSGRLELERLPLASLENVRETLMARDFHIFHYIGHGGVDAHTGEGYLAFTGSDGRRRRVTGGQLGVMLSNAPIRLAVLNSCEGGRVSDVDPYASTAIALVEQGIPAVVAMQFQITDVAATAFSRTLYDSVTAGRPVDLAVTLARQAVLAVSEDEWATPVLYLRAVDGVLFDLATPDGSATAVPVVVPVAAEQRAATPPVAQPPAVPRNVNAQVVDGVVDLVWQQPPSDEQPVHEWEVWRDGTLLAEVSSPTALDQPPSGDHTYSVIAIGANFIRSSTSRECRVSVVPPPLVSGGAATHGDAIPGAAIGTDASHAVGSQADAERMALAGTGSVPPGASDVAGGGGSRPPDGVGPGGDGGTPAEEAPLEWHVRRRPRVLALLLLLLVPLAVVLWFVTRPPGAPAAPTGVRASVARGVVTVTWDPAPQDGPAVNHWEVFRGAEFVRLATVQRASDTPLDAGSFTYTVVAVGEGGGRSASSLPSVVVVPDTTSTKTSTRTSPSTSTSTSASETSGSPSTRSTPTRTRTTTTEERLPTADVSLKRISVVPGANPSVTDLKYQTDNLGPDLAISETVTVIVEGPGVLTSATVSLGGEPARECQVVTAGATCQVGDHPAVGLATIFVRVERQGRSAITVTATVTSQTEDRVTRNNGNTYPLEPSSPPNS